MQRNATEHDLVDRSLPMAKTQEAHDPNPHNSHDDGHLSRNRRHNCACVESSPAFDQDASLPHRTKDEGITPRSKDEGTTPRSNGNCVPPTESNITSTNDNSTGTRTTLDAQRRLSLPGQRQRHRSVTDADPRSLHPELHLSGNVISATFCLPYEVKYGQGGDWVRPCLDYARYYANHA